MPAGRSAPWPVEHLKRAHLELGGNSALIVMDDVDIERASSIGAFGSFFHQGQICMTAGRHLVHASIAADYTAALAERASHLPVGDPATAEVALGPVIDAGQRDNIHRLVTASVEAGARLAAGGTYEELFYRPTVLGETPTTAPAYAEEVFGPVAPIVSYETLEEAVALATATEYGLSLGILAGDGLRALELAARIPTGAIHINDQTVSDEAPIPFGGVGASGTGSRLGGLANLDAFTETQWVTAAVRAGHLPVLADGLRPQPLVRDRRRRRGRRRAPRPGGARRARRAVPRRRRAPPWLWPTGAPTGATRCHSARSTPAASCAATTGSPSTAPAAASPCPARTTSRRAPTCAPTRSSSGDRGCSSGRAIPPSPTTTACRRSRSWSEPGWSCVYGMQLLDARYELLVDNLLDLSHETFLHAGLIGTPEVAATPIETNVDEDARVVRVSRHMDSAECPPFYARSTGLSSPIDRWQDIEFHAPGVYLLHSRIAPGGPAAARRRVRRARRPRRDPLRHHAVDGHDDLRLLAGGARLRHR